MAARLVKSMAANDTLSYTPTADVKVSVAWCNPGGGGSISVGGNSVASGGAAGEMIAGHFEFYAAAGVAVSMATGNNSRAVVSSVDA